MKVRINKEWVDVVGLGKDGKDGLTPQRGIDYFTPEDQENITEEIIKNFPTVSEIDFSGLGDGYFIEKINGEEKRHVVESDSIGRPTKIDNIIINW